MLFRSMERLKGALAQDNQVPPLVSNSNPASPNSTIMVSSSPCSPEPKLVNGSSPANNQTLSTPTHLALTRSNSVPAGSPSHTQQMQMQLPQYQQGQTEQQRQQLQYLNLQLQLQQLSIQQQQQNARKLTKTLSTPNEVSSSLSSELQNPLMGLQQVQQQVQQQFQTSLQNHISTSSKSQVAVSAAVSQMTPFSQHLQLPQQQLQGNQQSHMQSSTHHQPVYSIGQDMHPQSAPQTESQGLVSLREQSEVLDNRNHVQSVNNSNESNVTFSWQYQQQKQHSLFNGDLENHTQPPRSPDQPVFTMSPPQLDQHCNTPTSELNQTNNMRVKTESQFQRSYSERGTSEIPDRAYLRSEEHTSELQSRQYLVCRLLLEKKKNNNHNNNNKKNKTKNMKKAHEHTKHNSNIASPKASTCKTASVHITLRQYAVLT